MIQIGLALLLALLILGASRLLGFWAFLVLLGGILAHFGDHLGTVVGKKRLSLFGFRPKYTAILVNFTTGALITLASLIGAVLISAEYREALLGVQQKIAERERITTENTKLAGKLTESQERLKKLEGELQKADETREQLAHEIQEMSSQKEKAEQLANQLRITKETGTFAIGKGAMLVRHPLLVPIDVSRAQLKVGLVAMLAELREAVTASGIEVPPTTPEKVDSELVEPIYQKCVKFKDYYEKGSVYSDFGGAKPKQIYIRPVSRTNLARGEKLTGLFFDVQPNAVIIAKDEEIARTPINGTLPAQTLLNQLINFDKTVQKDLLQRGLLEESLNERVNRVSSDILMQFMGIIQLVKKENRWMEVRMYATSEITAYGNVSASYQVVERSDNGEPEPSPAPSPSPAGP